MKQYIFPLVAVAALALPARKVITTVETHARAKPYMDAINKASAQYGIPNGLLYNLLNTESAFRPEVIDGTKKSPTGAVGIAQFLPSTAADLLKVSKEEATRYVSDPFKAIPLAARYLSILRKDKRIGTWEEATAAYNQGAGGVSIAKRAAGKAGSSNWQNFLKPEGRNYVANIKTAMGGAIA